jgi:hypothetical protein
MRKVPKVPSLSHGRHDLFYVESDFDDWVTGDKFVGAGDTGAVAVEADVVGGVLDMETTALDNDETWLHTTQEAFRLGLAASTEFYPCGFDAIVRYEEVTADTAGIFVGFMNALATTPMQDDGAGVKANFCGFGFYRLDGGTLWNTIVDNLTAAFAQVTQELSLANTRNRFGAAIDAEESTVYHLHAECTPVALKAATILNLDFDFWMRDITNNTNFGCVVHENVDMTIADFDNMEAGCAIHAGDAQILHLYVDYFAAWQRRFPMEIATV